MWRGIHIPSCEERRGQVSPSPVPTPTQVWEKSQWLEMVGAGAKYLHFNLNYYLFNRCFPWLGLKSPSPGWFSRLFLSLPHTNQINLSRVPQTYSERPHLYVLIHALPPTFNAPTLYFPLSGHRCFLFQAVLPDYSSLNSPEYFPGPFFKALTTNVLSLQPGFKLLSESSGPGIHFVC